MFLVVLLWLDSRFLFMKPALRFAVVIGFALAAATGRADVVISGSGSFNFDPGAWASVAGGANVSGFEALTLDEVFDKSASSARTGAQILADEIVASPAYTGISFDLNGASVNNLPGRTAQPTTFSFGAGNPAGGTGQLGLGGVTRWSVNPLLGGGGLLFGDFTLSYDATRTQVGGSGWNLKGNIVPAGVVFDLQNVLASHVGNTLSITGDLGLSPEVATFLFGTPSDTGKNMGSFAFNGFTAVPESTAYPWIALGLCSLFVVVRRARD